jgi:hypothetical protein
MFGFFKPFLQLKTNEQTLALLRTPAANLPNFQTFQVFPYYHGNARERAEFLGKLIQDFFAFAENTTQDICVDFTLWGNVSDELQMEIAQLACQPRHGILYVQVQPCNQLRKRATTLGYITAREIGQHGLCSDLDVITYLYKKNRGAKWDVFIEETECINSNSDILDSILTQLN